MDNGVKEERVPTHELIFLFNGDFLSLQNNWIENNTV